jgi:hypothetical protein
VDNGSLTNLSLSRVSSSYHANLKNNFLYRQPSNDNQMKSYPSQAAIKYSSPSEEGAFQPLASFSSAQQIVSLTNQPQQFGFYSSLPPGQTVQTYSPKISVVNSQTLTANLSQPIIKFSFKDQNQPNIIQTTYTQSNQ